MFNIQQSPFLAWTFECTSLINYRNSFKDISLFFSRKASKYFFIHHMQLASHFQVPKTLTFKMRLMENLSH